MGRDRWLALPRLIREMIVHFSDGVALGCIVGLVIIRLDVGRIGSLLENAGSPMLTGLFLIQGALLFGTCHLSVAIMTLGDGRDSRRD